MEDEKFELLMRVLRATREKFDASIAKVKHKVAIAHERMTKDLSHKLDRSLYQF